MRRNGAAPWKNTPTPVIGRLLVRDVTDDRVLQILEPETASRVRGRIESVLDYATAKKYRSGDNPARWRGFLDKHLQSPEKSRK